MIQTPALLKLLPKIISLAQRTAEKILAVYHQPETLQVVQKDDNTPLTKADLIAHATLVQGLTALTPEYPILSEESELHPFSERQYWTQYWLIDPLDGTKGFIRHNDEFCINIAFIAQHRPIFGLIYLPVSQRCAYAIEGQGAFELATPPHQPIPLHSRSQKSSHVIVAISKKSAHLQCLPLVKQATTYHIIDCGSAIKFVNIAAGEADVYPHFGITSEWDTAAGQCIVTEAGGRVTDLHGKELQYNCKDSLLNPAFIVVGDRHYDWLKAFK